MSQKPWSPNQHTHSLTAQASGFISCPLALLGQLGQVILLFGIVAAPERPFCLNVFADDNYTLVILKTSKRDGWNEVMQMHIHIIICHVIIAPSSTQVLMAAHSQSTYVANAMQLEKPVCEGKRNRGLQNVSLFPSQCCCCCCLFFCFVLFCFNFSFSLYMRTVEAESLLLVILTKPEMHFSYQDVIIISSFQLHPLALQS